MSGNLYDRLGVSPTASQDEIRRAWLALARDHHPDFHAGDAQTRQRNEREMQSINEAWSVLGDPAKRKAYDERYGTDSKVTAPPPADYRFVPFDDDDDEIDPRLVEDAPVEGTEVHRSVQMLPIVLLVGGFLGIVGGFALATPFLLAVGVAGVVMAGGAFVAAPAVAIYRSIQAERRN